MASSCIGATIMGCDNVFCDGFAACSAQAEVTGATTVRCTGRLACVRARINATATVDCDSQTDQETCRRATITMIAAAGVSTPPVVTCTGEQSCEETSVDAGPSGIIVCSGRNACDGGAGTITTQS
eukprot:scaffold95344_cov55-Attheya_sp.AAC.1